MSTAVQSRSTGRRLFTMAARFEDKFRDWRRANKDLMYDETAIVEFMKGLVDGARAREFGKNQVVLAKVVSAERSASGHVDYEHKVALYCTELVLED